MSLVAGGARHAQPLKRHNQSAVEWIVSVEPVRIDAVSHDIAVVDSPQSARYEIHLDGERAGFVTYRLTPGVITFLHAEVPARLEGRGLGTRLVRDTLDDARSRGLVVRPLCPFVADFIERHREYADLVEPTPTA